MRSICQIAHSNTEAILPVKDFTQAYPTKKRPGWGVSSNSLPNRVATPQTCYYIRSPSGSEPPGLEGLSWLYQNSHMASPWINPTNIRDSPAVAEEPRTIPYLRKSGYRYPRFPVASLDNISRLLILEGSNISHPVPLSTISPRLKRGRLKNLSDIFIAYL